MTSLRDLPLFAALAGSRRILVAGAGGGFDVYGGLPLALALQEAGAEVWLGSLTFSHIAGPGTADIWLEPDLAAVGPDTRGYDDYFPERTLARWLERQGLPSTVYAFSKTGVQPLRAAYQHLVDLHGLDAVVLVDGGTDILMRGDEDGLGTPGEDMASLGAVAGLDVPVKLVVSIGFGIDAYHGVNHVQVLENLSDLEADGAYLGAFSIPRTSREGALYLDAVSDAQENTPARPSIVHGQIAAAMLGVAGNVHFTERTRGSTLFVNPLMSMYFAVTVPGLVKRHLYLDKIETTHTFSQIIGVIEKFRYQLADRRVPRMFPH